MNGPPCTSRLKPGAACRRTSPTRPDPPFVALPNAIVRRRDVGHGAKLMWGKARQFRGDGTACYASIDTLATALGIGETQARDYIRDLATAGLLRVTERRGATSLLIPLEPLRDSEPLRETEPLRDSARTRPGNRRGGVRKAEPKETTEEIETKQTVRRSHDLPTECFALADSLGSLVTARKRIHVDGKKRRLWADHIAKLATHDGVDYERQRRAMDWYLENAGGPYIPVVESGDAWRQKFTRVEAAMARGQGGLAAGLDAGDAPLVRRPTG